MKKLIALMLLLAFMLSLASCGEGGEQSVSESEASFEESEPFVLSTDIKKIDSFMKTDIDRSLKVKNLFYKKQYSTSRTPDDKYPDGGGKLTDGDSMELIYGSNTHTGFSGARPVAIIFDLGEGSEHNLADISISASKIKDYGIGLPRYVTVSASDNGNRYTELGRIDTPADIADTANYVYYFAFPKAVTARYIRVTLSAPDGSLMLLDEICGFEYCEDGQYYNTLGNKYDQYLTIEDYYGYELNLGESKVKISESDADYNELRNLATLEGVEFDIQHFEGFFEGHTNSGMDEIGKLTDGKLHYGDIENGYFRCYRGAGRHIVADLGHIMSVSGCTVSFQDRESWGITTPPVYYISVSENGEDWVTVFAEHNSDYGMNKPRFNDTRNISFKDEYRARYVRLTFATVPDSEVSCQVYIGEFEILGRKNAANAKPAVENRDTPYGRYPDAEELGIGDILWAGISDTVGVHSGDYHVITEQTAYDYMVSTEATGKELLFDSFAFTTRGSISWHAERNEGYSWFLDELFYEGLNIDAVEKAYGRVKQEFGLTEKMPVWISVNCPIIGDTFNGKEIKTAEDYIECLKWQVDEATARFNAKGYQNIYLMGFYWQVENLRPNHWAPDPAHDTEALIAFNEYIHSKGYKTIWAPYYSYLQGIWNSHYYGIDITCWQPNYVFNPAEHYRLDAIAELAKLYGVSIEIEIEPNRQSEESLERYRTYLAAGVKYGFIDSVNTYYQGAVPGAYVVYRDSEDEITKAIYEESVLYIQNKLDYDPREKEPADLSVYTDKTATVKHGEKVSISLGSLEGAEYRFAQTSVYGRVELCRDGTFKYTAMKNFAGEDVVKIDIYDGEGEIKTVTVTITVTEE